MNASPDDADSATATPGSAAHMAVTMVHGGFADFDDIVEALVETFEDEEEAADRLDEDAAEELVRGVWDARLTAQRDWPAVTEAERLLGVLRELAARHIVAEPHYTCCMRCGLTEIGSLSTSRSRGFVFFHEQDTERAVEGGGLTLAYGVFGGDPNGTAAVGREVADALTAAGLPVVWNGAASERIRVAPLEWRIRLTEPATV